MFSTIRTTRRLAVAGLSLTAAVCAVSTGLPGAAGAAQTPRTAHGINAKGMSPETTASGGCAPIIAANEQAAYAFFIGKGLSSVQSAGIIGNLDVESGVDPTKYQCGGGPGRGIAQWSAGGRWDTDSNDNLVAYAAQHGYNGWSLTA